MAARTSQQRRADIADALHSAAVQLLRGVRQEDTRVGLGPARLSALSVLVFAGGMRLTDLARIEQVRPPTMSKIVAGLEADGLVRRRPDARDRRAIRLEPTARGITLLKQGRRRRVARLAAALAGLTRDELETLARAASLIERIAPRI